MIHCFKCGADAPDNMLYCLHCGGVLETEPETIIRKKPPTGDVSDGWAWLIVILLTGMGVVGVLILSYR